ncbi:MAG: 3-isopropylmalate dehydratase small subunit [Gaiellales bacterium]|jgi:3-isopropylmalate/(R)-2-methylmalate dehydratase small subunit
MKPVRVVTGRVAALDRANVDTDQIIPKQFLKRIERTGFGEFLFWEWTKDPEFPLRRPEFQGAPILAAGRNFGSGSSREHAAWAIQDHGYEAVIAPSFSDIFKANCDMIGLLAVELDNASVRELLDRAPDEATVDLERCMVTLPSGREVAFAIGDEVRERLLNGWDEIALTERRMDVIERYERERERTGPNVLAL